MALLRGQLEPMGRKSVINTQPAVINDAQIILCVGISLSGGHGEPLRGPWIIPLVCHEEQSQTVLRFAVPLFRRPPIPIGRLGVVLFDADVLVIDPPEVVLRFGIAGARRGNQFLTG